MSFDPFFLDSVRDLYEPAQGTDRMAELLYTLIRFTRPRSVLEAGMGYTTPFIAKGLSDNRDDWKRECTEMKAKTAKYLAEIDTYPAEAAQAQSQPLGMAAAYSPKSTKLANRRTEWMFEDPSLARPSYYLAKYAPHAFCIDSLEDPTSSAPRVADKLSKLGLSEFVKIHTGDFWKLDPLTFPSESKSFDMIWIDVWLSVANALSLIEGPHWDLLNPNGGLLLIHCMLTNAGGQAIMAEFERVRRRRTVSPFEILGLIEPNKVMQNNVLIIKKTLGPPLEKVEDLFSAPAQTMFERDARSLVRSDKDI